MLCVLLILVHVLCMLLVHVLCVLLILVHVLCMLLVHVLCCCGLDSDDELINMIADIVTIGGLLVDETGATSTEHSAATSAEGRASSSIHKKFIDAINKANGKSTE